ncbi:MAG: DUF1353 domain-containing protein [FCB group bacterium]|nr:DUF1353 domain-containing protein [FCB group bacterium]
MKLTLDDMPKMRPVPIPTAGLAPLKRGWNWITKPRHWEIYEDWTYQPFGKPIIVIPAPFIFDGASIPRILWPLLSPVGVLLIPAIIHDYGYKYNHLWTHAPIQPQATGEAWPMWTHAPIQPQATGEAWPTHPEGRGLVHLWAERDQKFWDKLFRAVSIEVNGMKTVSDAAYWAVRLGGGMAWKRYRREEVNAMLESLELDETKPEAST